MSLTVENLDKRYGSIWALRKVNIKLEKNHTYALVAPNGSGKTTLIKSIMGLVVPNKGRILVDGKPNTKKTAKAKLRYTPEIPINPNWITARKLLELSAKLSGLDSIEARKEIRNVSELLGMESLLDRKLSRMSKGQRKRVVIAAGLIPLDNAVYTLMDEPFSGLDPEGIQSVREAISQLSRNGTILVSSHILRELEDIADRLIIMYRGVVLYQGRPEELAERVQVKPTVAIRTPHPGDAAKLLERAGYKVAVVTSAGLKVLVEDPSEAGRILDMLERNGIRVDSYSVSRGSLEDAYITLVRMYRDKIVG